MAMLYDSAISLGFTRRSGAELQTGISVCSSSAGTTLAGGIPPWGSLGTPSPVTSLVSGSGDSLSRRSLLALLNMDTASVLFPPASCDLPWLLSPPELLPVRTNAVDVEVIALSPRRALTRPGNTFPSTVELRESCMFPLRRLRVRALADNSGYMVSRIFTEFSCGPLTAAWPGAQDGSRPGTGSACFGVAAQNCNGEDTILPLAVAVDGDGEGSSGEACWSSSGHGDNTGGPGTSHKGETRPAGEDLEDGLELGTRGDSVRDVLGGVAISGGSKGGNGGPTSCRILLRVSGEQLVGVDISVPAVVGCAWLLGVCVFVLSPDTG